MPLFQKIKAKGKSDLCCRVSSFFDTFFQLQIVLRDSSFRGEAADDWCRVKRQTWFQVWKQTELIPVDPTQVKGDNSINFYWLHMISTRDKQHTRILHSMVQPNIA